MFKQVSEGVFWIQECVEATDTDTINLDEEQMPVWYESGRDIHGSNNAFLITGDESLIFDTGSPEATDTILADVAEILGDDGLDYVAISHHELPHAGNVDALLSEYPEATLVAASRGIMHDIHGLENAKLVADGETLNLGTHSVTFLEPKLYDTAIHTWLFEHSSGTLCTADWLAMPHLDSECLQETHELADVSERLVMGNGATLPWLEFVDIEKTNAAIDELLEAYQPSILAPAHGPPTTVDAVEFFRSGKHVIEQITEHGATPIVRG